MAAEVFNGQTYAVVPAASTTLVKSRPGRLAKLVFVAVAAGTVTCYDNDAAAAAGNILYQVVNPTAGQVVTLDIPFKKGLAVVTPAGVAPNVVYS